MSGYDVHIRRNADGLVRVCLCPQKWDSLYKNFWITGTYGCNCTRHLRFQRAGGEPDGEIPPCGRGLYTVLKFVLPDGTEMKGDDDAANVCGTFQENA